MGALFAAVAGCVATAAGQGGANAEPAVQWHGHRSSVVEETLIVATSPVEWEALWARVGTSAPVELPEDMIGVGIFLGVRPTAGYLIEVVSASTANGEFVVAYGERKPSGPVAMVITYPYLIQLFPNPGVPVRIEKLS